MPTTPANRRSARDVGAGRLSKSGGVQKPTKSIACVRCHSRKVKCSGGQPCSNCRQADINAEECIYPDRDRQVSLSEKYLEQVLEENSRLRSSLTAAETATFDRNHARTTSPTGARNDGSNTNNQSADDEDAVQNPLLGSRPWFLPVASLDMPIHIGEAADAAFATRLRQTIMNETTAHFPRMSYVSDERILELSEAPCDWPSPARARFLVKVALDSVCRFYHMVLRSDVQESVEQSLHDLSTCDRVSISRLYVLFALGEVYSTKTAAGSENEFPGLRYFVKGRRMISVPAERPKVTTVEICLLLSIYSFALNRRHSAYSFASSAVRLSVTLGLHLNVPTHQLRDLKVREHRNRLFWTAYTLDRTWGCKLGHPVSIQDEDVHVDPPSNASEISGDFADHDYMLHSIGLARLSERVISTLYSRRKQQGHFAQRVQTVLKDLTKWLDSMPEHLRLKDDAQAGSHGREIVYLHLRFNQLVTLATRPVLLNVLRNRLHPRSHQSAAPGGTVTDSAVTIAETCVRCARHSNRLLTNAWVEGSFAIFDYFNTQFLFSSASILAISSLLGTTESSEDGDRFQVAVELLDQLCQNGNFGAKEFSLHANAMMSTIEEYVAKKDTGMVATAPGFDPEQGPQLQHGGPGITAGMALAEPSLQEFLAQPDLDLQFLDAPAFIGSENPYGPELWGNHWSPAC